MNPTSACLDSGTLRDFLLGRTSDATATSVEAHLESCTACQEALPSIRAEDAFVAAFRAQAHQPPPKNAVLDRLAGDLRGLLQCLPASAGEATPSADREATPAPPDLTGPRTVTQPPGLRPARPTDSDAEDVRSLLAPPRQPDEMGRLGDYRVLKVLGSGGMGVVFLAEDARLRRHVALKAMKPALAASPKARRRFLREAQLTASITHDHIVAVHQVGEEKGVPFLAMPLLQGESLDARLKREGRLPLAEVLQIGRETAEGLAAAHEHGLIHRDIKPANLWLETLPGGRTRVKVLDFGLARGGDGDAPLTQSGVVVGTPAYMAPEQARGERVDARGDLFSLGCVLYKLCTGATPFAADDAMAMLLALATETPKPVCEVNPDVPAELSELVMRLLAKNPAERPQTAGEVIQAVQALEGRAAGFIPAVGAQPVGTRPTALAKTALRLAPASGGRKRRPWVLPAVAAGFLAAAVMATVVIIHYTDKDGKQQEIKVDVPGKLNGPPIVQQGDTPPAVARAPVNEVTGPRMHPGSLVSRPVTIKSVARWDIQTDQAQGAICDLAFTTDGRQLLVRHTNSHTRGRWNTWAFDAFDVVATVFDGDFEALAPDSQSCARVDGGTVQIWEKGDKEPRLKLQTGIEDLSGDGPFNQPRLKWAPKGSKLAVCGMGSKGVQLWDLKSGSRLWNHTGESCTGLVWMPDEKTLLVSTQGARLMVIDPSSGNVRSEIHDEHTPPDAPLDYSAASDLIAASSGTRVQLWSGNPPQMLAWFNDHEGARAVCSPDGKWIAYGAKDGEIKVYDVEKKRISQGIAGSGDTVEAVAFSADGNTLVSGGDDKVLRFWDVETGKARGILVLLTDDQWLAVSPEGRYRASPKAEGKFYFVVEPEGEKARNVTPAEFAEKCSWKNDPDKVHLTVP